VGTQNAKLEAAREAGVGNGDVPDLAPQNFLREVLDCAREGLRPVGSHVLMGIVPKDFYDLILKPNHGF